MRASRVAGLLASAVLAGPLLAQGAPAVSVHLTAGPSLRVKGPEVSDARRDWNGFSIDLAVVVPVGTNFRAVVAGGAMLAPDQNVYAPSFPGDPPFIRPAETVSYLRGGISYERSRLMLGAGMLFASASGGGESGSAPYAELRIRPTARSGFTVGVLGYQFRQPVGGYRALVTPTVGFRF